MLRPIGKALSFISKLLVVAFLLIKAIVRANLRKAFAALMRGLATAIQALLGLLRHLLLALIKPVLAVTGLAALFGVLSAMKDMAPPPVPKTTLAIAAPTAVAPPVSLKQTKQRQATLQLAHFHAGAQSFDTIDASITALADALNIPKQIVKNDLPRALDLAQSNASAMRPHVGHFPLPEDTDARLLAALTPSDVDHLRLLIDYSATVGKKHFTLAANMPSGDLSLEAKVTELPKGCFRYAMTFVRRSFQHTSAATACRKGSAWSFLEKRSIP